MSVRVKRNFPLMKWLFTAKPKSMKAILRHVDRDVLDSICEVCLNVLKGNVPLTPQQKRRLSKHKRTLRSLGTAPRLSDRSKRVLVQRGGFLGALIPTLISGLGLLFK